MGNSCMRPAVNPPVIRMAHELRTLEKQRAVVHQLTSDHIWQVTHGPPVKHWEAPTSTLADLSRGVPMIETQLVRPPKQVQHRQATCIARPNVNRRQLRDNDPSLLEGDPLTKLKMFYKEMELEMPPRPAPIQRQHATLERNSHLPAEWRRHAIPLSQWDAHPERNRNFLITQAAKTARSETHKRAALSRLLSEVKRIQPPRTPPS
ncbi:MAG: hypothetical protein SGPRY_003752 [Prymnesium sp.]